MSLEPVLIGGQWRPAQQVGSLRAVNPANGEPLGQEFPVSSWADCDAALAAASTAAPELAAVSPGAIGDFLEAWRGRLSNWDERH